MKKTTPLFALLLFVSSFLYAGDTSQVKVFNRMYVGISFTPSASYRYLVHNFYNDSPPPRGFTNQQVEKTIINVRNKEEKPGFGFDVGLKLGVRLTKFMCIETGVNYAQKTYRVDKRDLIFGSYNGMDTSRYYIELLYKYHYVTIPLALNFNFGKGKVCGAVNAGATFDLLITKTNTLTTNVPGVRNNTSKDGYTFNFFNFSPFVGVGMDYYVNKFMVLRIMPMAQLQALKNINTPITEHLWSAGVNISLMFGFKPIN